MVEEPVWVEKKYVRPRLSPDELWLIYRLIDNQYWLLRRNPHPLWNLEKVAKLHFPHPAHTRFLLIPEVQQSSESRSVNPGEDVQEKKMSLNRVFLY